MNRAPHIPTLIAALLAGCVLRGASAQTTRPGPHPGPATACIFSRDGFGVLVAQSDTIAVLSAHDGTKQKLLNPGLQRITSLALSPDGRLLLAGGGVPAVSGAAVLIERSSDRVIANADGFKDLVTSVAFSPDGKTVAAASADRTTRVLTLNDARTTPAPVTVLEGHAGPVLSVVFNNDGKVLVTASADRSIKVWDLPDGKLRRTLTNHTGSVFCLAGRASPPSGAPFTCASAGDDRTVRVWQPEIGRMVRIVRGHQGPVFAVACLPDGKIFSAGAEGVIRMIDADSDALLLEWKASDDWIYSLAVSPDGASLAAADWKGVLKLWRPAENHTTPQWRYPPP